MTRLDLRIFLDPSVFIAVSENFLPENGIQNARRDSYRNNQDKAPVHFPRSLQEPSCYFCFATCNVNAVEGLISQILEYYAPGGR